MKRTFIADNIRALRKEACLTQEKLANTLNIKRSLLGAYEEGRAEPKLYTVFLISRLFDVPIEKLIEKDGYKYQRSTGSTYEVKVQQAKDHEIMTKLCLISDLIDDIQNTIVK